MEGWTCALTAVADATGNVTQLYPAYAAVGVAPATATNADQVRQPCEGTLMSLQVETDGTNGGTLQLYDVNGLDADADVSSAAAITATQLNTLIAAGKARLMFEQNFAGSGLTPWAPVGPRGFMRGMAARFIGAAGTCTLNLSVRGGLRYLHGTH